jgi:hypothetical protein
VTCGTIDLRRGDDLSLRLTFSQEGVGRDMTGWTVTATTMDSSRVVTPLVVSWLDQTTGAGRITLDEEATAALKLGLHSVRVRVQSPDGVTTSSRVKPMEVTD